MNIVLFSPTWPLSKSANGITSYCSHLKSGLENEGHNVIIITSGLLGDSQSNVYEINYKPCLAIRLYLSILDFFSPGYRLYYCFSRSILCKLKEIQRLTSIDVFEMEESFGAQYFLQKKLDYPVILRIHGPHFITSEMSQTSSNKFDRNRIFREARTFKNATYITAPSKWVMRSVIERYRNEPELFEVIPNPIELAKTSKRWAIDSYSPMQILFVGRFDDIKGADVVLEAFSYALYKFPSLSLLFAGSDIGVYRDHEKLSFDEFSNKYLTIHEKKRVKFFGLTDVETIAELRKKSHITIVASRHESFGYTALEALAHSSPVIVSRVGGLPEVVEDNISGIFFEPGNAVDLGEKICGLLANDEQLGLLSKNALQRCESTFSSKNIAKKSLDFYANTVNHHAL